MSRRLDDLSSRFKPLAMELLARAVEAGIPVMIVDTLRTPAEQEENIAKGVSWTRNSRHLTGDAIDICPYDIYQLHGKNKLQWNATDPVWYRLALIGRAIGLTCGYDWTVRDMGHFEWKDPDKEVRA